MSTASLTLEDLLFGYKTPLFSPLTLQCQTGQCWALLGANGRGKSTLLDTLSGVRSPLGGRLIVNGGVSIVPQSFDPAFAWQVEEVVLMGRARQVALFSQPSAADHQRVLETLAQLGMAALAARQFSALSGGQQQLVMIARALVSDSRTILLDEPCSALDLANQQVVLQLICDLTRQQHSVIFTTHDPTHALQVASHTLLLLPNGEWLAGKTADVLTEQHLQQACGLPVRKLQPDEHHTPVLAPLFSLKH